MWTRRQVEKNTRGQEDKWTRNKLKRIQVD